MSFADVVEQFFEVFASLWTFITGNPLLMIGVFGPMIVISIIAVINAFR